MELWQPKYLLNSASKRTSFPPGQVAGFVTTKEALGSADPVLRDPSHFLLIWCSAQWVSQEIPCVCSRFGRLKGAYGQISLRSVDREKGERERRGRRPPSLPSSL